MGLYTLADFREETQLATGNMGLENSRLDRYINFAYFEIVGSVDFEALVDTQAFTTVIGQTNYPIPTGSALVKGVVNTSDPANSLLGYRALIEYYRFNRATNGSPRIWTRQGNEVLIAPYPDAAENFLMILRQDPARLVADADTTELPTTWDAGIFLLSAHFAKLSVNQPDAGAFYNRAVQYLASRVVDEDRVLRDSALGQSIGRVINGTPQAGV